MKTGFVFEMINYLAIAQEGENRMNKEWKAKALKKLELAKSLPRKKKKVMKKDAYLDLAFVNMNTNFNNFF